MTRLGVSIEEHRGLLRQRVGAANRRTEERAGLLVRLRDSSGRVGLGEASPLPGYSPDTLEECRLELELLPVDELDLSAPLLPQLERLPHGRPAARFAVETALCDLAGQRLGLPLAALLGEEPLRQSVTLSTVCDSLEAALAARDRHVQSFKVKIGAPGEFARELALLTSLREALGDAAELRADANQAFSRHDLPARLAALAPLRPRFIEEPLEGGLISGLAGAPLESPLPLAADETLQQPGALEALEPNITAGCVQVLVLKPMALGGFSACMALARRARELGAAVVVTHLWDGPIALAAAAQLALALPGELLACGLDQHAGLDAWPPMPVPFVGQSWLHAHNRPGLGLERRA